MEASALHCHHPHSDGLVQERRSSSALAMELHLSCTKPSIYVFIHKNWRLLKNQPSISAKFSWKIFLSTLKKMVLFYVFFLFVKFPVRGWYKLVLSVMLSCDCVKSDRVLRWLSCMMLCFVGGKLESNQNGFHQVSSQNITKMNLWSVWIFKSFA